MGWFLCQKDKTESKAEEVSEGKKKNEGKRKSLIKGRGKRVLSQYEKMRKQEWMKKKVRNRQEKKAKKEYSVI